MPQLLSPEQFVEAAAAAGFGVILLQTTVVVDGCTKMDFPNRVQERKRFFRKNPTGAAESREQALA